MGRYDLAELLAALWRLGAGDERMPTSHGILDKALHETASALPAAFRSELTFGVTGVGLRCYQLPSILLAAQETLLTSEPNPTYLSTIVTIDEDTASQIVLSHGISPSDARAMGEMVASAVSRIKTTTHCGREELAVA